MTGKEPTTSLIIKPGHQRLWFETRRVLPKFPRMLESSERMTVTIAAVCWPHSCVIVEQRRIGESLNRDKKRRVWKCVIICCIDRLTVWLKVESILSSVWLRLPSGPATLDLRELGNQQEAWSPPNFEKKFGCEEFLLVQRGSKRYPCMMNRKSCL